MSRVRFQLTGPAAVAAAAVVLLLVGGRALTLGETDEPALEEAIRAELAVRLGGRMGQELDRLDDADLDEARVRELVARADPEGIEVHSMAVSAPVGSGRGEVVVRVDFTLPDGARREEFWLFEHPTHGVWRYRRESSKLSYYLNVL